MAIPEGPAEFEKMLVKVKPRADFRIVYGWEEYLRGEWRTSSSKNCFDTQLMKDFVKTAAVQSRNTYSQVDEADATG
ncbi:unnamed protein product [Clonostachys rosea]|uniref:Uncharacterized protein n=1 Tax=Bionectria ochroleuca TaxID=29856 RepID=A0ABY6UFI0_BIOOC|nr:unnamed protein product [Clonostachys rosea]